jgi:hypothetical protein
VNAGLTTIDPLQATAPIPLSREQVWASDVAHVRVEGVPGAISKGDAVRVVVGKGT